MDSDGQHDSGEAPPACAAQCTGCGGAETRPAEAGGLTGWRLTAVAAGVFLVPLLLAVAGAIVLPRFWPGPAAQIVGGAGGLLVGVVLAVVAGRLCRSASRPA